MPKFKVIWYYDSFVEFEVEADSRGEAQKKVANKKLNKKEFLDNRSLEYVVVEEI